MVQQESLLIFSVLGLSMAAICSYKYTSDFKDDKDSEFSLHSTFVTLSVTTLIIGILLFLHN